VAATSQVVTASIANLSVAEREPTGTALAALADMTGDAIRDRSDGELLA
jgi:hypothetical protein